jgi:hypothetical protein
MLKILSTFYHHGRRICLIIQETISVYNTLAISSIGRTWKTSLLDLFRSLRPRIPSGICSSRHYVGSHRSGAEDSRSCCSTLCSPPAASPRTCRGPGSGRPPWLGALPRGFRRRHQHDWELARSCASRTAGNSPRARSSSSSAAAAGQELYELISWQLQGTRVEREEGNCSFAFSVDQCQTILEKCPTESYSEEGKCWESYN